MQNCALAAVISALDRSAVDSNLFSAFRIDPEACCGLGSDLILGLRSFDYVLGIVALLRCANQQLAAVHNDVHIRTLTIFTTCVVTDDNSAVGSNHNCRSIRHVDACSAISLSLYGIAGVKLSITA